MDGADGEDGQDGIDGVSPGVSIATIAGGHSVTITDAEHPAGQSFNVMDGTDGQDGEDGVSPGVTIASVTGGHAVTITDAAHPSGQSFNILDGDYTKPSGGIPYEDLASGVQASLDKADTALQQHQSLAAYRTAAAQDTIDGTQDTAIAAKYTKPAGGIPDTDLASGVQTSLGKADTAYQKPSGGIPASDLASGVIPTVPTAYTSNPAMDGTASAGSSGNWARGDHVHPTDTSRAAASDFGNTSKYISMNPNTSYPVDVPNNNAGLAIVTGGNTDMFDIILYKAAVNGQTVSMIRLLNASQIEVTTSPNNITFKNATTTSSMGRALVIKF